MQEKLKKHLKRHTHSNISSDQSTGADVADHVTEGTGQRFIKDLSQQQSVNRKINRTACKEAEQEQHQVSCSCTETRVSSSLVGLSALLHLISITDTVCTAEARLAVTIDL